MYGALGIDYEQIGSPVEYAFVYDLNFVKDHILDDGTIEVNIGDLALLFEILEDEEDIREGLEALADEEGTITWEQYQLQKKD